MRLPLLAGLTALMLLSACGGHFRDSKLNPRNWFHGSRVVSADAMAVPEVKDARLLVAQVTDLVIEETPSGAIVRATGLPASQGWWDAELVARPDDGSGVRIYDFRVFPPLVPRPAGTPQTREIVVATALSKADLAGIDEIVVQGATNARSSRR